jgi:hypothetical protein
MSCLRQYHRDRCRQRRLAVVYVTDRADVDVRLVPFKLLFGHVAWSPPTLFGIPRRFAGLIAGEPAGDI